MSDIGAQAEYAVIKNAVRTLSIVCAGNEAKVIDLLTGYLWDEEEAGEIKASDGIPRLTWVLNPSPPTEAKARDGQCG